MLYKVLIMSLMLTHQKYMTTETRPQRTTYGF